jgi:hypothetical protein
MLIDPSSPALLGTSIRPWTDHYAYNKHWLGELLRGHELSAASVFIPGSMFIGSGRFLEILKQSDLLRYRFEDEKGQLDGCLHHAVERYLGVIARSVDVAR